MDTQPFVSPDEIRTRFSRTMSDMYRAEVPQYGTLMRLVSEVNERTLKADPGLAGDLERTDDLDRIDLERHGAIRVGTAEELSTLRRLFAVMGMAAVGYYDLSVAGVPVHSTAFRPVSDESLARNPFRVFTSLLRLELIADEALRRDAADILSRRRIFTPRAIELIETHERAGGLGEGEADAFVREAVETFRWHGEATVDADTYRRLAASHRLVADVVSFKGPHINHLTPRTLDIDRVQAEMPRHGISAKDTVEGAPPRRRPILLRQTSFKALEEAILFRGEGGGEAGTHTARFGEIEQRGLALTRKGRELYDRLLATVREEGGAGSTGADYAERLARAFEAFPDDDDALRREGLGYFRYVATGKPREAEMGDPQTLPIETLVERGHARAYPIVYEDFLPVSAAGIFQSNLGGQEQRSYGSNASREAFLEALGGPVLDEFDIYEAAEARSIEAVRRALGEALGPGASEAPEGVLSRPVSCSTALSPPRGRRS